MLQTPTQVRIRAGLVPVEDVAGDAWSPSRRTPEQPCGGSYGSLAAVPAMQACFTFHLCADFQRLLSPSPECLLPNDRPAWLVPRNTLQMVAPC